MMLMSHWWDCRLPPSKNKTLGVREGDWARFYKKHRQWIGKKWCDRVHRMRKLLFTRDASLLLIGFSVFFFLNIQIDSLDFYILQFITFMRPSTETYLIKNEMKFTELRRNINTAADTCDSIHPFTLTSFKNYCYKVSHHFLHFNTTTSTVCFHIISSYFLFANKE